MNKDKTNNAIVFINSNYANVRLSSGLRICLDHQAVGVSILF